jgi:hypothetical protein
MKVQFKSMLLCIAVSFIVFTGCKKPSPPIATTIEQVSLTVDKNNTETRTFKATGGIKTSGTFVMQVKYVGEDSIYCINKLSSDDGTFTTDMRCSMMTNTGAWSIIDATGKYAHMTGGGTLVMTYPEGVIGIETLKGYVSNGY